MLGIQSCTSYGRVGLNVWVDEKTPDPRFSVRAERGPRAYPHKDRPSGASQGLVRFPVSLNRVGFVNGLGVRDRVDVYGCEEKGEAGAT